MKRIAILGFLFVATISANAQSVNGRATTAAPSYLNATSAPLSLDLSGNLRTTLGASSTIIGNVRIDQTTPGTTNGVQVNAALPVGANIIGSVGATNFPATVDTNSGNKSASTLRVVLATDQPALSNKLLVTPDSVALPANQSVNVSQINGVTPLMGAGNTGTGSPRVTQATDQAALAAWGHGATGAAAPAGATQAGARSGANIVGIIQADTSKQITMSSATTTEFIALSGSTKIYVTSFDIISAGITNVTLVYGTGTNCGTGTTPLAGLYTLTAQAGIAKGSGLGPVLVVPAGNAFCVTNSQAIVIGGSISYTQF